MKIKWLQAFFYLLEILKFGMYRIKNGVKCKYLGKVEKAYTIMEATKIHNTNMTAIIEKEDYWYFQQVQRKP